MKDKLIEFRDDLEDLGLEDSCWGVRLDEKGQVILFYHPYGCEDEWVSGVNDKDKILDKIKKREEWLNKKKI